MKSTWALLALAVGAFGIGTTEFAPMGLLPVIAEGVNVSIPSAGLLISENASLAVQRDLLRWLDLFASTYVSSGGYNATYAKWWGEAPPVLTPIW